MRARILNGRSILPHELGRAVGRTEARPGPVPDAHHPDHALVARAFVVQIGESSGRHA
jgi:hypothetical protein